MEMKRSNINRVLMVKDEDDSCKRTDRSRAAWRYLKAASRAVLRDDTHVWGVNAGTDEASQVFVMNISHL